MVEGHQSGGSGGRDASSWYHLMRKPAPDSVPWKRGRHNMPSVDQEDISSAITVNSNFSNDGMHTNVSTGEDDDQKPHKDTSKTSPSVSTNKLNTNQLAAKILRLRTKGKHDEADQLSSVLDDQDTPVDDPRHEKEGAQSADRRKGEKDADRHAADLIVLSKHYNMARSVEDEYDLGVVPRRKSKEAHEEKSATHRHILTQKDMLLWLQHESENHNNGLLCASGSNDIHSDYSSQLMKLKKNGPNTRRRSLFQQLVTFGKSSLRTFPTSM